MMAKSFIRIVNELAESSSEKEKLKLSDEASRALVSRKQQASSLVVPLIENLAISEELIRFGEISQGEFYDLEIRPYVDVDGFLRVSIQMTFLQDFENSEDQLSEKVAVFLFGELLKRNLDILVNDICINDVQHRNGVLN